MNNATDSVLNDVGDWGCLHPEAWVVINVLLCGIAAPLTLAYLLTWWAARPWKTEKPEGGGS